MLLLEELDPLYNVLIRCPLSVHDCKALYSLCLPLGTVLFILISVANCRFCFPTWAMYSLCIYSFCVVLSLYIHLDYCTVWYIPLGHCTVSIYTVGYGTAFVHTLRGTVLPQCISVGHCTVSVHNPLSTLQSQYFSLRYRNPSVHTYAALYFLCFSGVLYCFSPYLWRTVLPV